MSYFNGYRINFAGGFYTNVDTANNYQSLTDPVNAMIQPELAKRTDDELRDYLMQRTKDETGAPLISGWNFMGDHVTRFLNAKVTSLGLPMEVVDQGSTIGTPVFILGAGGEGAPVMVDTDPCGGGVATMIFVGGLQLGLGDQAVKIIADTVCYSYYMGPRFGSLEPPSGQRGFSSLGVWFQFVLPKSALPAEAADPGIKKLLDAARAANGLVVRFAVFEVTPAISADKLYQDYLKNKIMVSNPAFGYLIGTIGVWREGELETSPPGRILTNHATEQEGGPFSPVLANYDSESGILSLDLVNAIPKAQYRTDKADVTAIGPNVDVGRLTLSNKEITPGNEENGAFVVNFSTDPVNYWRYGGIVDFKPGPQVAKELIGRPLYLTGEKGKPGLKWVEEPYRVESDQRAVFLANPDDSRDITLKVTHYGQIPTEPFDLDFSTDSSGVTPDPENLRFWQGSTSIKLLSLPAGTGTVTITVKTNGQPGLSQIGVIASGPAGKTINGGFLNGVRVFPLDDYSDVIAKGNIPWAFVYENVLRYYYVIFPAMSLRFPLNDEATVTIPGIALQIKARMDDRLFKSTKYMPITRCMSPGKRALLFAFLDERIAAAGAKP